MSTMNHLEKGLKKASKVMNERGEESPGGNSDKENSTSGSSSVRQFYGNKGNRSSLIDSMMNKASPSLPRCPSDPFHDLSSSSLNVESSPDVKTYQRSKVQPKKRRRLLNPNLDLSVLDSSPERSSGGGTPDKKSKLSLDGMSEEEQLKLAMRNSLAESVSQDEGVSLSLDQALEESMEIPTQEIGFPNAGMTCYLNAVLQSLLGQRAFSSALLSCEDLVESSGGEELFNVFIKVARDKANGQQDLVRHSLFQLRRSLRQIVPKFDDASMQDAHEFLVKFFEILGDTLKENRDTIKTCPFSQIFEFEMSELKECLNCHHTTSKLKTEWLLRLDMPLLSTTENVSIQMLAAKTLQSTMEMRCTNCNCDNQFSVLEKFSKLPPILIVYLPRSLFINQNQKSKKNRSLILTDLVLKLPDLVTSNVDCSKLSHQTRELKSTGEKPKPKFRLDCSLTPEKKPKPAGMSDKDINSMSEEEQLRLAMQKSLCESSQIDEEENLQLAKAMEESMKESGFIPDTNDAIDIPLDCTATASGDYDYQLTATVCHVNWSSISVEIGHYIADVYNKDRRQWYRYNDMRVTSADTKKVVQQSSYDGVLCFYTHRNFILQSA